MEFAVPAGPSSIAYLDAADPKVAYAACSEDERRILDRINQKVAAAESLEDIMNFVFDAIRPISPCDRVGLAFLEENRARVAAHWARADYEPMLLTKGYAEDLHGSSLETVLERGVPRVINDLDAYLDAHPESRSTRIIVREGVQSSMTCPLIVEGRPVGFLFRSSRLKNAYDEHQVNMQTAIAERLSQAVEKTLRIEQLAAANRAYTETLGFVSHELRSPLAAIVMNAQALTGGYLGPLTDPQRERIGRMVVKANYLLELIEEFMTLSGLEGGELEACIGTDIDFVGAVLNPALDIIEEALKAKRMTLTWNVPKAPVPAACDPRLMKIVVVNLLGNAVKYGDEEGEVRVSATASEAGIEVKVWNSGPGFPETEHHKLFRRFSRVNTPELMKRKGTGIGLFTCWRIIQLHGGRIWADSREGEWAEFTFRLPEPGTKR